MNSQKILITGAGIAGATLAYWLHREGHHITVVEKSPQLRMGGQNIDISDAAVDIVKMMGIEAEILKHNTTEIGIQFVNEKNRAEAVFPKGAPIGFTSKYEILRGDLAEILVNLTSAEVEYRFGDTVTEIEEQSDALLIKFKRGRVENYDLLISAEGVSSRTRKLILGVNNPYKYLGVYTSYMTLPKREGDRQWARWYNATEGRVLLLRPDNKGTTRASVNVWCEEPPRPPNSNAEAISWIQEKLKGAGWEADRIAKDIAKNDDVYLGPVSQVRLACWSKGRCVLVGDAAYCPTPFTGMGTSLAIIGAYVLAGELARDDNHARAFRDYEAALRPFVTEIQKVFPGQFRMVYPKSLIGVKAFRTVLKGFASSPVQKLTSLLQKKSKDPERKFQLPKYRMTKYRMK